MSPASTVAHLVQCEVLPLTVWVGAATNAVLANVAAVEVLVVGVLVEAAAKLQLWYAVPEPIICQLLFKDVCSMRNRYDVPSHPCR